MFVESQENTNDESVYLCVDPPQKHITRTQGVDRSLQFEITEIRSDRY